MPATHRSIEDGQEYCSLHQHSTQLRLQVTQCGNGVKSTYGLYDIFAQSLLYYVRDVWPTCGTVLLWKAFM